ncbi:hypothetical protein CLV63_10828 [Murinocardiopsis flavida]|uniref:Uncharacterized protein n=1 Tax=Murinocardiopsis flavida TaxID=645275 RepID=A0A2P8DJB1_9ACTN|nr:hypothetical protein [Murinocardiopsis flavida]PSK97310.1 hypothetical protein CLV63_10828 [Murinocardiopsis flavida]
MAVRPMPGAVKALRAMLFIVGVIVLLSGGITLMSAMGTLDSAAADVLAAQGAGMASSVVLGIAGLAYGIASIVCGALVGRATTAVEWGISIALFGYVIVNVLISFLDGVSIHGVVILPVVITLLTRTTSAKEYFAHGSHSRDGA